MNKVMARGRDPVAKFIRWLDDARGLQIPNYEAMALATADPDGQPSVRFVLLKGIDQRGFVFFTDSRSRKGRELRANPRASLAFYWQSNGRQVRVRGRASLLRAPHIRVRHSARAHRYSRRWLDCPRNCEAAKSHARAGG
jgi:pyridoxamine 5'-phosphate oxidase